MNNCIYNIGYAIGNCCSFLICNLCCCNLCLHCFYNFGDGFSQSFIDSEVNKLNTNNNEI